MIKYFCHHLSDFLLSTVQLWYSLSQKQNLLKRMSIQQYLRDYAYCYNCGYPYENSHQLS